MKRGPKEAWSGGRGAPASNVADDAGLGGIDDDDDVVEIHVPPRIPRGIIMNARVEDVEDEENLMPPGSAGALPDVESLAKKQSNICDETNEPGKREADSSDVQEGSAPFEERNAQPSTISADSDETGRRGSSFNNTPAIWMKGYAPHVDLSHGRSHETEGLQVLEAAKHAAAPPKSTVFIWDMDETLIIFQSLKTRKFSQKNRSEKDDDIAARLWEKWKAAIEEVTALLEATLGEDTLEIQKTAQNLAEFYAEAECSKYGTMVGGVPNPSGPAKTYQLSEKFRDLEKIYSEGVANLVSSQRAEEWEKLYEETDEFTDRWLSAGRDLLKACRREPTADHSVGKWNRLVSWGRERTSSESSSQEDLNDRQSSRMQRCKRRKLSEDGRRLAETGANVSLVVTSAALVPTFAKFMLYRLNDLIDPKNVYSSRGVGKLRCFERIRSRFAAPRELPAVQFCVVGDGTEELSSARAMAWAVARVEGEEGRRLPDLTLGDLKEGLRDRE